jgi:hypothetical protein
VRVPGLPFLYALSLPGAYLSEKTFLVDGPTGCRQLCAKAWEARDRDPRCAAIFVRKKPSVANNAEPQKLPIPEVGPVYDPSPHPTCNPDPRPNLASVSDPAAASIEPSGEAAVGYSPQVDREPVAAGEAASTSERTMTCAEKEQEEKEEEEKEEERYAQLPLVSFVDQGVYTRNRAFRLYLSSKFGKSARLLPLAATTADSTCTEQQDACLAVPAIAQWPPRPLHDTAPLRRTFLNSLVANVNVVDTMCLLSCGVTSPMPPSRATDINRA